jgi:hypothetical protein
MHVDFPTVTFYRDSMFLAAMAFFTSAVAPDLKASTMDLPLWASCLSNLVLQSRFGRVFFVQGPDKAVGLNFFVFMFQFRNMTFYEKTSKVPV